MLFRFSNRWYSFRMDLLGTITILITAGVCIFSRDTVSPAEAGLALANIFQVATFVPYVMRMKADFRARFNSVERVCEYAYYLDQEAPLRNEKTKPPQNWPEKGALEFKVLNFRYRPSMPLVLKNLTFKIEAGSKVGVVGRTGAGKTTLFGAILRLTEVDSGSILIDDVDVGQIGLADLRSAIAVIPQDPVLFQVTHTF
jgi:ABC-type multidrug transport system fused ATPase/permease subunit